MLLKACNQKLWVDTFREVAFMSPADARAEFARVLQDVRSALVRRADETAIIEGEWKAALESAVASECRKKSIRRGRKSAPEILSAAEIAALHAPFKARFNEVWDSCTRAEREGEAMLVKLAAIAEIRPGALRVVQSVWSMSYSTQGYAAGTYARGRAEVYAVELTARGINASVRQSDAGFEVVVPLESELDVEICRRAPTLPFKEWLRAVLKQGCNPWVFQPFLPPNVLETVGLTWFGEDCT